MTNTTTPVESLGAPSAAATFYGWEVPEKPIAVHINLDLVDRLEREAIESFKAVTKRGSEIGGVLVGRTAPGTKRTVYLEEYEPVECEYSRGPLYMLAEADKERLKQALDRVKAGPRSVVGFFRSNTRSNLILDEEDLALAKEFFPDPSHVFLLVRPFSMKASLGGLFFWENGQIHSEGCYLPFPFKRSELLANFAGFLVAAPEKVEAPGPPPVPKEPLVMPKREERPAIPGPISFKREEPKPTAVVPPRREEAPAPPPVMKREEPRPAPPPPPPVARREEAKPAPPPVVKREERAAPPPMAKREEPKPAPPHVMRREEPKPTLVAPRREEHKQEDRISPLGRREERAAGPSIVPKEPPAPPVVKKEERPAPPPPPVKREERPAVVVKEEKPPAAVKKEEKPEVTPVAAKREEAVVVIEEKPPVAKPAAPVKAAEPVKVAEPVKAAEPVTPVEPVKKEEPAAIFAGELKPGMFVWLKWVILAVLLVVGGAYFVFSPKGGRETASSPAAPTALGLRVERNAGQLLLSWNKDASIMATATQAILTILDGESKEDVSLDIAQLRSVGSIVYSPITNDVSFRLEVTDLKNHRSVSEQTRFVSGRPSPLAAMAPPAAAKPAPAVADTKPEPAATPVTTPLPAQPAPAAAAPAPPPPVEQPKVVAGPAVTAQPPKPESLASRLRAPEPQELPAPPVIDSAAGTLPSRSLTLPAVPAAPAPGPAQPVAPPPVRPPQTAAAKPPAQPAPAAAPSALVRTGGQAQEARLLRRFPPSYPALARQTRVSGIVRVQAIISKDGKVKRATAVSGPPLLRQAALEAVMRWVYAPATLNGEAVEAETQVDVNFML